jgi:hypothetical protein
MSEAAARPAASPVEELKVTGHLMALDAGLYCIVASRSPAAGGPSGLPAVRITPAPGPIGRPEAVTVRSFRDDGLLSGAGDAALVRITGGPAQVLVTVYQAQGAKDAAPKLQVTRLSDAAAAAPAGAPAGGQVPAPVPAAASPDQPARKAEVLAHVQARGDVAVPLGEWMGEKGSGRWIEGFAIAPDGIAPSDIEYQAVLGKGWLSPWVEGTQFCGSRGMALPVLGLRVRLRNEISKTSALRIEASFIDGSTAGPVADGEVCEGAALAPLEAFRVEVVSRGGAGKAAAGVAADAGSKTARAARRRA